VREHGELMYVQEEEARRERLARAHASLAEEQRRNAERSTRSAEAKERLALLQVRKFLL
jgi:hypothetical protein